MFVEIILLPLWFLIDSLIDVIPDSAMVAAFDSSFMKVLGYGISIIGVENFTMMIGAVLFWYTAQLVWSIVEWIYKKIPGVN